MAAVKPLHWGIAAAGVVVLGAAAWATMAGGEGAGDLAAPGKQPAPLDDIARFTGYSNDGHPGHVCPVADHHAGYVYTRHRYPRTVGGEISAVIHRGFSPMRVPSGTPDEQWIVAPPSEVMF